jgi:hypothetical protein
MDTDKNSIDNIKHLNDALSFNHSKYLKLCVEK